MKPHEFRYEILRLIGELVKLTSSPNDPPEPVTKLRPGGAGLWGFLEWLRPDHWEAELLRLLRLIVRRLAGRPVTHFTITQENPVQPFSPGNTGIVLVATPNYLPGAASPQEVSGASWSQSGSDLTITPDTTDPTGLTLDVSVSTSAAVGNTGTVTVSFTNPDGQGATGSLSYTIVSSVTPPPPPVSNDVQSFSVAQTE